MHFGAPVVQVKTIRYPITHVLLYIVNIKCIISKSKTSFYGYWNGKTDHYVSSYLTRLAICSVSSKWSLLMSMPGHPNRRTVPGSVMALSSICEGGWPSTLTMMPSTLILQLTGWDCRHRRVPRVNPRGGSAKAWNRASAESTHTTLFKLIEVVGKRSNSSAMPVPVMFIT